MQYRRAFIPGGTYFFTLVTFRRQPIFADPHAVGFLRGALRRTMERMPFTIVASVVLPDHMHFIWTLPTDNSDFSTRWRLIKSDFTRHWCKRGAVSENASRLKKGEQDVWQRRFWEHAIRDDEDLMRHVEYVHYNPVKHGLVKSAVDWEYSSFRKYEEEGLYAVDWGTCRQVWAGSPGME